MSADPRAGSSVHVAGMRGADQDRAFAGQVAVVTGGTEGIGLAIAHRLGRSGARLVVASRRPAAVRRAGTTLRATGIEVLARPADVRDEAAVQDLVQAADHRFGRIDILVNNAGGSFGDRFRRGPLLDLGADDLVEAFRLNVTSAFLCAKAVVPVMRRGGGGVIVNVASMAAFRAPAPMAAYGASKAALVSLTQSMAGEWAPSIRVNAVAPGHIDTPRVTSRRSPERLAAMLESIPLCRLGTPEDVAGAVAYLAGPEASWMSGTVIQLHGGGWD